MAGRLCGCARDLAGAEGTAFMRADIAQGVEAALHIEDADAGAPAERHDDLAPARWYLRDFADDDAPHARTASIMSSLMRRNSRAFSAKMRRCMRSSSLGKTVTGSFQSKCGKSVQKISVSSACSMSSI